MKQQFDLQYQFGLYLQRMGFAGKVIPRQQYTELKRAFFGACGQMLFLFRGEIGTIESEEEAISVMKDMIDQVGNFWLSEQSKHN